MPRDFGQRFPDAPVFLYHGSEDEIAPMRISISIRAPSLMLSSDDWRDATTSSTTI